LAVDLKNYVNSEPEDFLVLASGMIHADHLVEQGEIRYCYKLITDMFGETVSDQKFEEIVNEYSEEKFEVALSNYNKHYENLEHNDDDEYLIIALIILGLSDFRIDPDEIVYLEKIGVKLNIDREKILELIKKTEDLSSSLNIEKF
tara:strand:- start:155 stop:592 length:438 start_codon:yes stop_codon:yes gene_type:complete